MIYYQIKNWDKIYESHETKKLKRLHWIPMPNKHDGLGFRKISKQKDAAEIFCAWILLVQIASKCDTRGILIRENLPLSPDDAADMTGFPPEIFNKAITFLPSIGWIERIDTDFEISPDKSGDVPDVSGDCPAVLHYPTLNGITGKRIDNREEEDTKEKKPISPSTAAIRLKVKNGIPLTPEEAKL